MGSFSEDEHLKIIRFLEENSSKLEKVILVGEEFSRLSGNRFQVFKDREACKNWLLENQHEGMYILIKGSRGLMLEKLIDVL
jgi:UDP-N-acetylmuramoyl-tripeptide--D-alanyl-D-alanine ligase